MWSLADHRPRDREPGHVSGDPETGTIVRLPACRVQVAKASQLRRHEPHNLPSVENRRAGEREGRNQKVARVQERNKIAGRQEGYRRQRFPRE